MIELKPLMTILATKLYILLKLKEIYGILLVVMLMVLVESLMLVWSIIHLPNGPIMAVEV